MTDYFANSSTGNNANNGTSNALAKLTATAALALAVNPGDRAILKGIFRETITVPNSGGNLYATGTVSVTKDSPIVTGSGTTFVGNTFINGVFQSQVLASGTDGVTNGTATFTSAAGNFQASMIGLTIRIGTKGAYTISAVASATSITLKNPDASAPSPASGSSLTYNVGPESPYDILSVDSNTQLTLAKPWSGPTLTGIAYQCWRPIFIIGDVSGALTDGVGGIVRLTGSDNDTTATRTNCISSTTKNYITIQGLAIDFASGDNISLSGCANVIIQDCQFQQISSSSYCIDSLSSGQANITVRRCELIGGRQLFIATHSSTIDDAGHLIENCLITGHAGLNAIEIVRIGGVLCRNITTFGANGAYKVTTAPSTGQAMTVNNCSIQSCANGFNSTSSGFIVEDFNNIAYTSTPRTNTLTGANSTALVTMFSYAALLAGYRFPWQYGALSQWSTLTAKAGMNPPADDFFGMLRPSTNAACSWGAIQFNPVVRATGTKDAGSASLSLPVAGRHQIIVNVANVSTTISIKVYREANYAGSNPGFVIKQAGVADIIVTDAGSASAWNTITTTFTPAATTNTVIVELFSLNTATSGSFVVYFDTMLVTTALTTGGFEQWITDRIPLSNYAGTAGTTSTVVSGTPFRGPFG